MNGAEAILRTLANNGVEVCFTNPGTSEMQVVSAFDREQRVRPVLCLFEGVATGAADGYARMTGKPASTLLHLGAGLANGSANLTTRGAPIRRSSISSAITPLITARWTRRSPRTSPVWPAKLDLGQDRRDAGRGGGSRHPKRSQPARPALAAQRP